MFKKSNDMFNSSGIKKPEDQDKNFGWHSELHKKTKEILARDQKIKDDIKKRFK